MVRVPIRLETVKGEFIAMSYWDTNDGDYNELPMCFCWPEADRYFEYSNASNKRQAIYWELNWYCPVANHSHYLTPCDLPAVGERECFSVRLETAAGDFVRVLYDIDFNPIIHWVEAGRYFCWDHVPHSKRWIEMTPQQVKHSPLTPSALKI